MGHDNIILIGMPGSGKSTLGVLLARALNYRFLDTDLLIQEREGKLLCEIIEERGRDGFLAVEGEVNAGICAGRTVIAPGGSAIYHAGAMEHFKEIGIVVYLHVPLEELGKRLGDLRRRGVILKEGQSLQTLYEERSVYYERYADISVNVTGQDISDILEEIKEKVREKMR